MSSYRQRKAGNKQRKKCRSRRLSKKTRRKSRTRYAKGAGLLSTAMNLASNPRLAHGVLSAANRLAPVAQKFMSMSPQGAMLNQTMQAAAPYLQQYRQNPQAAVRSVMNSPVAQQVMSHVSTHLPMLQQTATCIMNPPTGEAMNSSYQQAAPQWNRPQNMGGLEYSQQAYSQQSSGQWQGGKRRRRRSNKSIKKKPKVTRKRLSESK